MAEGSESRRGGEARESELILCDETPGLVEDGEAKEAPRGCPAERPDDHAGWKGLAEAPVGSDDVHEGARGVGNPAEAPAGAQWPEAAEGALPPGKGGKAVEEPRESPKGASLDTGSSPVLP